MLNLWNHHKENHGGKLRGRVGKYHPELRMKQWEFKTNNLLAPKKKHKKPSNWKLNEVDIRADFLWVELQRKSEKKIILLQYNFGHFDKGQFYVLLNQKKIKLKIHPTRDQP